jgi:hypothetical protein
MSKGIFDLSVQFWIIKNKYQTLCQGNFSWQNGRLFHSVKIQTFFKSEKDS